MPTLGELRARIKIIQAALGTLNATLNGDDNALAVEFQLRDTRRVFADQAQPAMTMLADMLNMPIAPAAGTDAAVAAAPAQKPPPSSFGEFVGEIGRAMVAAQQGLDVASNLYSQGGGPLVSPTSYRIPKLTASMRFALEKTKERGFDLLIYSSTETARELNQQTLDLELVAVPASPDFVAAVEARRPRLALLTGAAQRASLIEAFLADLAHDASAALEAVRDAPGRVVLAIGAARKTGAASLVEDVLVLFTTPDPPGAQPGQAAAWYMTVLDGVPQPDAAALVPFGDARDGTPQRLLHNLAEPLSSAQAALLVPAA